MDSDSWIRLSTNSKRYQSRSDFYHIEEEYEGEEESRPEFLCPFCGEDFDIVGLCVHIDEEHAIEAKNGICPVCAKRAGMNLVGHITQQHGNILKVQRKRRFRRGGSNSALSILRKELREGSLQCILGGSSRLVSSSTTDPDPLLSTFINSSASVDEIPGVQPLSSAEACSTQESIVENLPDRYSSIYYTSVISTSSLPLMLGKWMRKCGLKGNEVFSNGTFKNICMTLVGFLFFMLVPPWLIGSPYFMSVSN